jgi:hypothetical protein
MTTDNFHTLFTKVGSIHKVRETSDAIAERLQADPHLRHCCTSPAVIKLTSMKLLKMALSNQQSTSRKQRADHMRSSLQQLFPGHHDCNEVHFDVVLHHFTQAVLFVEWPTELVDEALQNLIPLRNSIAQGRTQGMSMKTAIAQ